MKVLILILSKKLYLLGTSLLFWLILLQLNKFNQSLFLISQRSPGRMTNQRNPAPELSLRRQECLIKRINSIPSRKPKYHSSSTSLGSSSDHSDSDSDCNAPDVPPIDHDQVYFCKVPLVYLLYHNYFCLGGLSHT